LSRLAERFKQVKRRGEKGLIVYITCGDGGADVSVESSIRMAEAGADVLELGVPFNDPVADGPVIQVVMSYYNPIYAYGAEQFCKDAAARGVDGILVVDLPADSADELLPLAGASGLDMIFLLTPVSGPDRITLTLERASGFIYFVSVTGVTGARDMLPAELADQVRKVKAGTDLPVCVGFGVAGPDSAKKVASFCDGVVVGSAIVKAMHEAEEPAETAGSMVRGLKEALR
jgi:tryptophan synthase alpha chain